QKRDLIGQLIKAQPEKSNRRIAKTVGVSHPHVAKVRDDLEGSGDVETVTTSIDTRGRKQPAKKARAQQQHDDTAGTEALRHEIGTALEDLIRRWELVLSTLNAPKASLSKAEPGDQDDDVADPRTVKKNVLGTIRNQNEDCRKALKAAYLQDTAQAKNVFHVIDRCRAQAKAYRKVIKVSRFQDTQRAEIKTAIEGLIQNLRFRIRK